MSQNVGAESAKKGMSTGAKWAIGCAIAFVAFVVLCAVVAILFGVYVKNKIEASVKKYEAQGYTKVLGQQLVISERLTAKTVYVCQSVALMAGSDVDVAMICQEATIHGKVNGTIHFTGQTITIEKDAEITGSLDVTAQFVNVYGAVDGGVVGTRQVLNNQGTIGPGAPAAGAQESAPSGMTLPAESTGEAPSGATPAAESTDASATM